MNGMTKSFQSYLEVGEFQLSFLFPLPMTIAIDVKFRMETK
jgi:hypothetical protein